MGTAQGRICVLAVKGGRIAALGASREEAEREAPAGSEILEFPHGWVRPGFWDCHVHVASLGATAAGCWLYDARSIEEIISRVAQYASQNLEKPVVAGRAANVDAATLAEGRLPTAQDLDRAERERPVIISDVNKCVGNSAALAAAGLTAHTPDPPGGEVERGKDGEPTGVVWFGARAALEKLLPRGRVVDFAERFSAGLQALAARGVTVAVDGYEGPEQIEAVRRLDAGGRLPCRVIVQVAASSEEQLRAFEASGLEFGGELGPMSRVGPAKLFFDQFVMHRTARMFGPYEGEPENLGGYFNPPEELPRRIRAAFARGFPVAVHVTGDRGIVEAADILARELGRGGPDGSFIIHGYFAPEGAPERMAELGIGLAAQPAFLYHWADTLERFVGRERTEHFYPLDRCLAAGVAVGASADAPIADPDPLLGLYAMTTRRSASGRVWGQQHALPMAQALELYTGSATRLFSWSGFPGLLAVGQQADFVVLDRNPMETKPEDVRSVRVLATFVAGRATFRAARKIGDCPY